jgi:predicted phage replisome organizer
MAEKRYYWLKLKKDFFKRHDIRIIEAMPNGKDYILFYLKLLCESVDHDGNLRFSEQIPYNEDMLATITNTNVDIVRSAIKIFTQLNMMELMDDGTFFMSEVNKMIGSESYWAEKKRLQRAKEPQEAIEDKSRTLSGQNSTFEVKSKSTDKELEKEKETNKKRRFSPPTLEEVRTYCQERGNNVNPEQFYTYYAENDWHLSNGKKMQSWKSSVITWEQNRKNSQKQTTFASYQQREESGDNLKGFRIKKTNVSAEEIRKRLQNH